MNCAAVGRRCPVTAFADKDFVPAKAVTGRFAPQRRISIPRTP